MLPWSHLLCNSSEKGSSTRQPTLRMVHAWTSEHKGSGVKDIKVHYYVTVFNLFAPSNTNSTQEAVYRHENEKRSYEERVREVEHGSFTSLSFSATEGMGKAATVMYMPATSFTPVSEEGTAVLQDHELAQMPVDVLTAHVSHHLHPGGTFCNE